ncbi:MAG: histidine phosphatase family protein [Actinomycetota bacterium]
MLYLVRHGRTEANAGGRLQGRIDLPIDEVGRAQAQALVNVVPEPDVLVCSPLLRARQTAEVFGKAPVIDDRWIELSYGDYEGVPIGDVPPDVWNRWVNDLSFTPPGGESIHTLSERVVGACEALLEQARHQTVVVVSHATPIKVAMGWALGVDASVTWRSFIDQASVTTVAIRDRGPVLTAFNIVPPR